MTSSPFRRSPCTATERCSSRTACATPLQVWIGVERPVTHRRSPALQRGAARDTHSRPRHATRRGGPGALRQPRRPRRPRARHPPPRGDRRPLDPGQRPRRTAAWRATPGRPRAARRWLPRGRTARHDGRARVRPRLHRRRVGRSDRRRRRRAGARTSSAACSTDSAQRPSISAASAVDDALTSRATSVPLCSGSQTTAISAPVPWMAASTSWARIGSSAAPSASARLARESAASASETSTRLSIT